MCIYTSIHEYMYIYTYTHILCTYIFYDMTYIYLYVHESIYMRISFLAAQIITCSLPCLKHDTSFEVRGESPPFGMCPFGTNPKWYQNCPYIQYWFNKWYHNKDITGIYWYIYIYWWYTGYFPNLEFAKPKKSSHLCHVQEPWSTTDCGRVIGPRPMTLVWQKTALSE